MVPHNDEVTRNLNVNSSPREWRTWGGSVTPDVVRRFRGRTIASIDFVQWSGYKQNYCPENAHGGQSPNDVATGGVCDTRCHYFSFSLRLSPEHGRGQIQRAGRMRVQQLSWEHSAETGHARCPERVQHLGRAGQARPRLPGFIE